MILPKKGDWLVCENGHRAYRALVDQRNGTIQSADFVDEDGRPPPFMTRALCPRCKGDIMQPNGSGYIPIRMERKATA
jgi:hypothetical protein